MPKPKLRLNGAAATSTSSASAFDAPFNSTSTSTPSPPPSSVIIYKAILEEELKESGKHDKAFFWGLVFLAASAFAAAARPDLVPAAFLLFALTALPARAVGFARRGWGYFMLDFCYFANVAVAAWLLFGERGEGGVGRWKDRGGSSESEPAMRGNLRAAVVALAEGPLAAAALAWRCSWCPGMPMSHLISTLVHVLPGAALFAREVTAAAATTAGAGGGGKQRRPSLFFFSFAKQQAEQQQQQQPRASLLWSLQYQFLAPLLFYLAWQLFYFCVVQVACRESILRNGHDTSYRCLARRAARADNFWNLIVRGREPCEVTGALRPSGSSSELDERRGLRRGTTAAARCLRYGGVQLAFTASTLAAAAVVTGHHRVPWSCWQVCKFAAPLWYGVEAAAKARRRVAERRVERAVAEAAAAAAGVNNKN